MFIVVGNVDTYKMYEISVIDKNRREIARRDTDVPKGQVVLYSDTNSVIKVLFERHMESRCPV